MAKQRRTRKQRTVEDVEKDIAQIELQIEMLKLDKQKLLLEKKFMEGSTDTK